MKPRVPGAVDFFRLVLDLGQRNPGTTGID
jgi:hypothetical protein